MNIFQFPLPFYLSCLAILSVAFYAYKARYQAWGLPACAVLGTAVFWYIGDALYNDYDVYKLQIGESSLTSAWWQFLWFIISFALLVKPVFRWINQNLIHRKSRVMIYLERDAIMHPLVQNRLDRVAKALVQVWVVLMIIGLIRVKGDVVGLFAPYLGHKSNPWARGQIGGGISAILSLAAYFQIFLTAAFGVIAALAKNKQTRSIALLICFLAFPFYIFDRTRSTMIAVVLPGILAYVFLRLRCSMLMKFGLLGGLFLVINAWFLFVLANRTGGSIAQTFNQDKQEKKGGKHLGLNMFEELAWIDHFTKTGAYKPNWGQRYFAEIVNPVPRIIWKNKPTIGLDYAVARGQSVRGAKGEVTATISTGMIGQGVVNFGRILGPLCAAFLMSLWVALVGRQDLKGENPGNLILYGLGLIFVFNLGRDITLLNVYPFLFGLLGLWIWEKYSPEARVGKVKVRKI